MHENDVRKPVALLARPGPARERLRQALEDAGARIVLEEEPAALDAAALSGAAAQAVLVALEPAVEDALEALEPALEAPGMLVIFDEADLAARREGWEAQRWARHLAAKLHGHDDVLPPRGEPEPAAVPEPLPVPEPEPEPEPERWPAPPQIHADARVEPPSAQAQAAADVLPQDRPGLPPLPTADWLLDEGGAVPAAPSTGRLPPPLPPPDFSRLELVALEEPASASAPAVSARATGAVLVIAGIGGPDAVRKLLVALPRNFRQPVLVQLRLDGGRYDNLVKQMARVSSLPVAMAVPGEALAGACAYVLPEDVGLGADAQGLRFVEAQPGADAMAALPPSESALLLLSGADPARVDAALALAARGAQVAGQALEGCYDATAVKLLAAGGIELGAPAQLAERLAARWG